MAIAYFMHPRRIPLESPYCFSAKVTMSILWLVGKRYQLVTIGCMTDQTANDASVQQKHSMNTCRQKLVPPRTKMLHKHCLSWKNSSAKTLVPRRQLLRNTSKKKQSDQQSSQRALSKIICGEVTTRRSSIAFCKIELDLFVFCFFIVFLFFRFCLFNIFL